MSQMLSLHKQVDTYSNFFRLKQTNILDIDESNVSSGKPKFRICCIGTKNAVD